MTKHLLRGAAIGASLLMLAAACSSSDKTGTGTTTGTGTPVTNSDGSHVTTPDHVDVTYPATGAGVAVTDTKGNVVTSPTGGIVTTPAPTVPGQTTTPTTAPRPAMRWKLALDFRTHPNTNPFAGYSGGAAVWSLRQSQTLSRNGNYTKLPTYSATFGASGVSAWHGNGSTCGGVPAIGVAVVGPSRVCNATIPPTAAFAIPDKNHLAVVAWTSPFNGTATVSGGIADLDPSCGDGIRYYVDRGTTDLVSKTLTNGNSMTVQPVRTRISKGQSLYFIVDPGPNGNADCDATQLQITVDLT